MLKAPGADEPDLGPTPAPPMGPEPMGGPDPMMGGSPGPIGGGPDGPAMDEPMPDAPDMDNDGGDDNSPKKTIQQELRTSSMGCDWILRNLRT